jgi:hypothetical protein
MIDRETLLEVLELGEKRRAARRNFLKTAGITVAAAGGASLLAACDSANDDDVVPPVTTGPTPTPSSVTQNDVDILNFALNLEYLETNYYVSSAFGSPLNATLRTGTGAQGDVVGGRAVNFTDPSIAAYAREIAADENQHVVFLRTQLGGAAIAMPQINIDGGATGAFTAAARSAGVIGATETFDPYASDENWLLGGMLLSDVGVTAYKGSARLINSATILDAAAGILAVEAYHSGLLRTMLYRKGLNAPVLRVNAGKISDARDALDGAADLDQGITGDATTSNIVPADSNGIVFGRTAAQVLNIAYLSKAAVSAGGFFPNGANGNIKTSANNA